MRLLLSPLIGFIAAILARASWVVFAMALLTGGAQAQESADEGSIAGVVLDGWSARPLGGVIVTVRGTTLAGTTDSEGRFQLRGAPAGNQVVVFSRPGYARAIVTDVRVAPGQTSNVNLQLRPEFHEMEEFEITAEEAGQQFEDLLADRQNASSMTDAIGSDMFKNLAVGDAAQALSKVTGATVADGKYAVIRGLADRYTFTTLNGLELPSADPDRKAFQLDMMPSKFMERLDVYKTFTPDMSGGFAGGSVDIVTKSYPDDFLFELRAGTAYNTQSSLRDDFLVSDHGSTDWLGFDDGKRAMPGLVEEQPASGQQFYPEEAKSSFKSSQFAPVQGDSPVDSSFELLFGDTQQLFGRRFGYLAGLNYKTEYRMYQNGLVRSFDQGGRVASIDKTDAQATIDYQWGGLVNLNYELFEGHELKFNYLRVQSAQDRARRAVGQDGDVTSVEDGTYVDQSILTWNERSLNYFQLAGGHEIPALEGLRFDWGAATSFTTQDEPDSRIFQFYADPQNDYYSADLPSAQPNFPARFWRELEERNKSFRGDFTIPVASYNEEENFIRTGAALNLSGRDYQQRGIFALRSGRHPFENVGDPNIWMEEGSLTNINLRNFPANISYEGEQSVTAGYLLADWAALSWLRLVGGARYETTDIQLDTFNITQDRPLAPGAIQQDDWLPSLSAKIQLPRDVELRASWSRTVVRPTYREIAESPIYDVTQNRTYLGNPAIQMSASENFDLRASWYPRPGEIVSLAAFTKTIARPIELSSIRTDNSQIRYENFSEAEVQGVEAELRMKLDRLWNPLEDFTLGFNAAYITSEVPLTSDQILNRASYGASDASRPLYDQPEYILNGGLTWDYQPSGTSVTLSGGVVGQSLVLVGLAKPDEFLQPSPELNLFVRQRFAKNWDLRFTAKNLLNPAYEVGQTWPGEGLKILQSYTRGVTLGLSVGCEF